MLQVRTGARAPRPLGVLEPLRAAWGRVAVSDPGLLRLTLAARGTLSVFLTTVASLVVVRWAGLSIVDFASAITLSLMAPFLMREPTLRQRRRTLLVLPVPVFAAAVVTTLLQGHGTAGDSCFLVLVFGCFLVQPRSPRLIGVGLVAVVATYVDLFLELPAATLKWQFVSLALAVPIIAFCCFVALPMRPVATLRRMVAAVQGRAAQVLRTARDLPDGHAMSPAAEARLRRDLSALNEAALAADDQLGLLHSAESDAVRAGLIHLELATARLIGALGTAGVRGRRAVRLALHERRMRRGGAYAMPPGTPALGSLRASLVGLGHAVHALGEAAQAVGPQQAAPAAMQPPGPLAWRLATRVTLAAGLAMAGGMALSPNRWFWAVMTVYVVFLNARSRGDTILKGLQRLAGTLFGIVSGLLLATALSGHPWPETAVLLLSVFGMYYFFLASYTAGIFFVTVVLGLVYGMLGAAPETLLVLRLEETAIGAVAAMLVAAFVLPTRTRDQVMRSGQGVLNSLVAALQAVQAQLSGQEGATPLVAMRQVDRQVADLRLALAPLVAGRSVLRRGALDRPVPALLDCVHWMRVLAAASHAADPDPVLAARAGSIALRFAGLARRPTEAEPPSPQTTPHEAMDALDRAVTLLAERLQVSTLAGFAL